MFPRTIHKYRHIEPVNKCSSHEIPAAEINYGTSDRRMLVVIDQQLCMIANIDVFYYKYFSTMYMLKQEYLSFVEYFWHR